MQRFLVLPAQSQSLSAHNQLAKCSPAHLAMASILATIDAGGGGPPPILN